LIALLLMLLAGGALGLAAVVPYGTESS
jgi:hypothetical protein